MFVAKDNDEKNMFSCSYLYIKFSSDALRTMQVLTHNNTTDGIHTRF